MVEHVSPALGHLCAADSVLGRIVGRFGAEALAHVVDPARGGRYPATHAYGALVRVILGQQVSVGAARSMVSRLSERFDGTTGNAGLPDCR
jgi:3-methyladenine DNA glycosylase/8-oxoguanine DNA glycosylase